MCLSDTLLEQLRRWHSLRVICHFFCVAFLLCDPSDTKGLHATWSRETEILPSHRNEAAPASAFSHLQMSSCFRDFLYNWLAAVFFFQRDAVVIITRPKPIHFKFSHSVDVAVSWSGLRVSSSLFYYAFPWPCPEEFWGLLIFVSNNSWHHFLVFSIADSSPTPWALRGWGIFFPSCSWPSWTCYRDV